VEGCGEERSTGADVGADDMRLLQPERIGKAHNELAHRARRHERVASLGVSEAWEVDRHKVRVLGKPRPRRLERIQALRPRAEEESMYTPSRVLTLGVTDGQPINCAKLRLDGRVQ
jgi:hypothetical protein